MDVEEVGPDRDASPVGKGRARFALPLPPRLAEAVLTLGLGVAALAALPLRGAEATGRDLLIFGTLFAIGLLLARVSLREQVARWRFALARGAGLAAALALAGDLLSGAVLGCALTLAHSGGLRTSRSLPAIGAGLAVAAGTVALLAPHLALPIALVFVATLLPRLAAAPAARYPTKKPESAPEGLFLVNALGASPGEPERFSQHLARAEIGGCSLLDATLVADRPALLRSLSVALREGQAQTLELRLARPDAPGYIARRLTIEPLAPATGLAAIRLDRPVPAATAASGTRLEAALHDLVAPFNAGFGYLELLADPLLASTDPATRHGHAREARRSVGEAYRNQRVLGLWLRALVRETPDAPALLSTVIRRALRAEGFADDGFEPEIDGLVADPLVAELAVADRLRRQAHARPGLSPTPVIERRAGMLRVTFAGLGATDTAGDRLSAALAEWLARRAGIETAPDFIAVPETEAGARSAPVRLRAAS